MHPSPRRFNRSHSHFGTLLGCLLLLSAQACNRTTEPPPAAPASELPDAQPQADATPATTATWQPSPEEEAMARALQARDAAPACDELEALSSEPETALIAVIEHVTMPPYVGIRAATCLIDGASIELTPTLVRWVSDPNTAGLATLVLTEIAALPVEVAHPIAAAALAGPHRETAQRLLTDSTDPHIQQLCTEAAADSEAPAR